MLQQEERAEYTEKLERLIQGTTRILQMPNNDVVTPEMRGRLSTLQDKAERLLPKLRSGEFEIAIVGLEKAGKSSFSNALIGRVALPTADQRCTYTSTCIRAADEGSEQSQARVSFYSLVEFTEDFHEKLTKLKIPDAEQYTLDTLNLEQYEQMFEAADETTKRLYRDSLHQDILDILKHKSELKRHIGSKPREFHNEEVESEELKAYITDPGRAIAVKDVVIQSTELKDMPEAVIYDIPGFNSPTAMHLEQTRDKMRSADAIIMIARADEPSITADVLGVFRDQMDQDDCYLTDKLFVFANRADQATDLEQNKNKTYEEWMQTRKIISKQDRIVFGSANAHLGDAVPGGMDSRRRLEELHVPDGIEALRDKLQNYYARERFQILKRRTNDLIHDVLHVFEDARTRFAPDAKYSVAEERSKLVVHLTDELRQALQSGLKALKEEINAQVTKDRPLAAQVTKRIHDTINIDRYGLRPEEVQVANQSIGGIGPAEQPTKLDSALREQRFREMYGAFMEAVLGTAESGHDEVNSRILDVFMTSMGLERFNPSYSRIRDDMAAKFRLNAVTGREYYDSLVVRFARDLFEIQIKFSRADRINKFTEKCDLFLSMGVFYNAAMADGSQDRLAFASRAPEDSMMWRILLQPTSVQAGDRTHHAAPDKASSDADAAPDGGKATASVPTPDDLLQQFDRDGVLSRSNNAKRLLKQLIQAEGVNAAYTLFHLIQSVPPTNSTSAWRENLLQALRSHLETSRAQGSKTSSAPGRPPGSQGKPPAAAAAGPPSEARISLTDVLSGTETLEKEGRGSQYTYDTVVSEFADDIEALREVLLSAFVRAVDMDTAFQARTTKLIEDIVDELYSADFGDYIAENVSSIRAPELAEIVAREERQQAAVAAMTEIQRILDEVTG